MTRFLHLTDLHLRSDAPAPQTGEDSPADRLRKILAIEPAPDFAIISGDLAHSGEAGSYALLAECLSGCPFPFFLALGNHDDRSAFRTVFPGHADSDGPVCRDAAAGGLHVIVLDTLVEGRTGGALTDATLAFLDAALQRHEGVSKLVVLHHPPAFGDEEAAWHALTATSSRRLHERLARIAPIAILSGHVHLDKVTLWNGIPVISNGGLANAIDPLSREELTITEGASYGMCEFGSGGLTYSFVPVHPARRELGRVPVAGLKGGI